LAKKLHLFKKEEDKPFHIEPPFCIFIDITFKPKKMNKSQLKQIIKEEIQSLLKGKKNLLELFSYGDNENNQPRMLKAYMSGGAPADANKDEITLARAFVKKIAGGTGEVPRMNNGSIDDILSGMEPRMVDKLKNIYNSLPNKFAIEMMRRKGVGEAFTVEKTGKDTFKIK
jgi:hypothetical protein